MFALLDKHVVSPLLQPEGYTGTPHNVTVPGDTNRADLISLQSGVLYSVAVQGSTLAGAGPMSNSVTESYTSVTSMTYSHESSTTPTPGGRTYTFFKAHTPLHLMHVLGIN